MLLKEAVVFVAFFVEISGDVGADGIVDSVDVEFFCFGIGFLVGKFDVFFGVWVRFFIGLIGILL